MARPAIGAGDQGQQSGLPFGRPGPTRIIGVATILTDPVEIEADPGESAFDRDPMKFAGVRRRVRLHVDTIVEPRFGRSDVRRHPVLASLPNLQFANATNFKLSAEQVNALDAVIRDPTGWEPRPRYFIAAASDRYPGTWERAEELGLGATQPIEADQRGGPGR